MTLRKAIASIVQNENINFLLTNRIPRQALTRFMGWFSKIEHPWVRDASLAIWRLFSDLDLSEAKQTQYKSLHDCFTRELKEGSRVVDMNSAVIASPCDAIVGMCGTIDDDRVLQAKGFPYTLMDLLGDSALVERYRHGTYVTLRLTSTMYHRFHAPYSGVVKKVNYISGDTWNVNPIALKRVEKLFCKNERAVIEMEIIPSGDLITLVPVAAVLVASIRLHFLDVLLHLKYRGPNTISCDAPFEKGQEMGWFEHGSTIIVFAPSGYELCPYIKQGHRIKMGEALVAVPVVQQA
jgi:phosphatidylserine decarboxylase